MGRPKQSKSGKRDVFRDRDGKSFGDRLTYVKKRYALVSGSVSNREIAARVAAKLGAGESYTGATVSGWLRNQWVPDTNVVAALAELFRCDPGWLEFGSSTQAPSPDAIDRRETEGDFAQRVADLLLKERGLLPPIPETRGGPGPARRHSTGSIKRRPREA